MKHHSFKFFLIAIISVLSCFAAYSQDKISEERQSLIDFSLDLLGTPYLYSGRTPKGFDCSGFVSYVADKVANVKLSPQSSAMYAELEHISAQNREPGDLIFFAYKTSNGSYVIQHVGIYLGLYQGSNEALNGKYIFIHSASDGPYTGVIISSIDESYWNNLFYGYARFLPATNSKPSVAYID